jgi:D-alanyl-D-alanine carboxypeptidase
VLTAYLALRSGRLASSLTVSRYAASMQPSKIGLKPGWSMNVNDLVYATLLNSANDASVVLAEGLAGSVPEFAQHMNQTAWRLGARNSHFVNPNGLNDDGHYSTVRDLTTIMRAALAVEPFEQILSTRETHITPEGGSRRNIVLRSHNRMLEDERTRVIGKTGFTRAAKKCFVGLAIQDNRSMLVALLGSSDLWGDLRRMVDFAFDNPEDPSLDGGGRYRPRPTDWQQAAASPPGLPKVRGSRYHVQVASFRTRKEADRLRRKVVSLGYSARIDSKPLPRDRAELQHARLGSQGGAEAPAHLPRFTQRRRRARVGWAPPPSEVRAARLNDAPRPRRARSRRGSPVAARCCRRAPSCAQSRGRAPGG